MTKPWAFLKAVLCLIHYQQSWTLVIVSKYVFDHWFPFQAAGTQTVYSLSANTAGVNVLGATDGIGLLQGAGCCAAWDFLALPW